MRYPISNLEKVYWDLATKYKLRKEQIEEVILSQFRFVDFTIRNTDITKDVKGINLTHIGKFLPRFEILVKKEALSKKLIDVEDIISLSEVFGANGKVIKNQCKINIKNEGEFLLNSSYTKAKEHIFPNKNNIGFYVNK